jgi:hypothetical protein
MPLLKARQSRAWHLAYNDRPVPMVWYACEGHGGTVQCVRCAGLGVATAFAAVVRYALANIGPLSINIDAIPMQAYGGGLFTVSTCHSFFRAINLGLVAFLCATSVPEEKWTEASF